MTHFGLTPEAVRTQGDVTHLKLVEPIRMDETLLTTLEPPRIEEGRALLLAGLPQPNSNAMASKPARRSPRNGSASRHTWAMCPARSAASPTACSTTATTPATPTT